MNDLYKEFLSRIEKSNDSNRKRATEKDMPKDLELLEKILMI